MAGIGIAVTCSLGALNSNRVSESNGVSPVQYDGLSLAQRIQISSPASKQKEYISATGNNSFSTYISGNSSNRIC